MSTQTNADLCNGSGLCVNGGTTSCGNYTCNVNACRTSCTVTADCSGSFACVGNVCQ
jgi:hypothetical protein